MKPKKPRKPRGIATFKYAADVDGGASIYMNGFPLTARDCRRLSKWLESAARYLESKGER